MGFGREDVEFSSEGTICRAWMYRPEHRKARPLPCIVMAAGLGGTRDGGLEPYAARFAAAGFCVLLFDYRCFGASDGEPRQLVSIARQLRDWGNAIRYVRHLRHVDPARLVLWGTALSGGHAIVAGARDGRIAAVIAQGPVTDGLRTAMAFVRYAGIGPMLQLGTLGVLDGLKALAGLPPQYVPVIAPRGQLAALASQDAEAYYAIAAPGWRNEMSARLVLELIAYRPAEQAQQLRCPFLVQVCKRDSVVPAATAIAAARRNRDRARLQVYDLGHFDIYVGPGFERAIADQLDFLQGVLGAPDGTRGRGGQAAA
jgi:pimeloyl-ACP methyl ester carboxylesterase